LILRQKKLIEGRVSSRQKFYRTPSGAKVGEGERSRDRRTAM